MLKRVEGAVPLCLYPPLQADIDTTGALLRIRTELFENILTETISHTLRARIGKRPMDLKI